jgi:conjugal transfer/entry exclusion protein
VGRVKDKDKDYKEFFEGVIGIAQQIHEMQKQALNEYKPIVENIIKSRNSNVNHIEHVLDRLVDIAADGEGLELYRRLCRHLYSLNQQSALFYVQSWKEMWDEEGERFGRRSADIPNYPEKPDS